MVNLFDGRLPPGWTIQPTGTPNMYTVHSASGQVTATMVDSTMPADAIIRRCWEQHLIPAVEREPGNLGLRQAGFSKYWRMPSEEITKYSRGTLTCCKRNQ